jgi:hypothetical protein
MAECAEVERSASTESADHHRGREGGAVISLHARLGAAACLICIASPATAQTISGVVRDMENGAPVAGADVTVFFDGGQRLGAIVTDSAGRFVVRAWRGGEFRLDVEHVAFQSRSVMVAAALGERVEIVLPLHASAAVLDTIEVQARVRPQLAESGLGGFEERRRWGELLGIGRFLGPQQLAGAGSMETVLGSVPGLRLIDHPTCNGVKMVVSGRSFMSLRNTRGGLRGQCSDMTPQKEAQLGICRVSFIVDGVPARLSGSERIDDLVLASLVAGIEVYRTPAELPAEYSGSNSRCGVVAIWTKR